MEHKGMHYLMRFVKSFNIKKKQQLELLEKVYENYIYI